MTNKKNIADNDKIGIKGGNLIKGRFSRFISDNEIGSPLEDCLKIADQMRKCYKIGKEYYKNNASWK